MKKLDPEKLYVTYRKVKKTQPIIPRRYTLTHSDITGELFLTIGLRYAYDKIGPMRDEVLAEWYAADHIYVLCVRVHVDIQSGSKQMSEMRYKIFKRELPLALEAIRYGDRALFKAHSKLNYSPIWVYFESIYPEFDVVEYWGTPKLKCP